MLDRLPYFPHDELSGANLDADLAADVCELSAFFSSNGIFLLTDLRNDIEIGEDDYLDVDAHNRFGSEPIDAAVAVVERRTKLLGEAYPFILDESGYALTFQDVSTWGRSGYLLGLILSHLRAVSPVLDEADLEPSAADQMTLRDWFQKIAAPALAAEICGGTAWAFGHPRPDHSPFLDKLKSIWSTIKDGEVKAEAPVGAPDKVKDDEVDVIAARPNPDGEPGFPIAVAQVATGKRWTEKSVKGAVQNVFFEFWFNDSPSSQVQSYHIIPFVVKSESMRRNTLSLGHIIHRLRIASLLSIAQIAVAERRIEA
ncbi:MAG: hypothetical protein KDC54_00530, partial [Lewinella sp.]|nr:hypothetical protein [Lewinella sp.]